MDRRAATLAIGLVAMILLQDWGARIGLQVAVLGSDDPDRHRDAQLVGIAAATLAALILVGVRNPAGRRATASPIGQLVVVLAVLLVGALLNIVFASVAPGSKAVRPGEVWAALVLYAVACVTLFLPMLNRAVRRHGDLAAHMRQVGLVALAALGLGLAVEQLLAQVFRELPARRSIGYLITFPALTVLTAAWSASAVETVAGLRAPQALPGAKALKRLFFRRDWWLLAALVLTALALAAAYGALAYPVTEERTWATSGGIGWVGLGAACAGLVLLPLVVSTGVALYLHDIRLPRTGLVLVVGGLAIAAGLSAVAAVVAGLSGVAAPGAVPWHLVGSAVAATATGPLALLMVRAVARRFESPG